MTQTPETEAQPAAAAPSPLITVLKGNPTDQELAALITVLTCAGGRPASNVTDEHTRWGLPVDRLRYAISNYQRITLQELTHMRL